MIEQNASAGSTPAAAGMSTMRSPEPRVVFDDGAVRVIHGDSRDVLTWLEEGEVLVTDPPYGIGYRTGSMSNARTPLVEEIEGDVDTTSRDRALTLWGDRPALVFGSWRRPRPRGTKQRLIWHKRTALPGFSRAPWYSAEEEIYVLGTGWLGLPEQNVIVTDDRRDGASGEVARLGHPTPKPVSLLERLIRHAPPGLIVDPFMGTGSTLIAARNAGRRAIGIEIEERHCLTAAQRLTSIPLFTLEDEEPP